MSDNREQGGWQGMRMDRARLKSKRCGSCPEHKSLWDTKVQ